MAYRQTEEIMTSFDDLNELKSDMIELINAVRNDYLNRVISVDIDFQTFHITVEIKRDDND